MKIYVRPIAREDILRQYRYYLIEENAPNAARRFLESVEAATSSIRRAPGMGAPKLLHHPLLSGLRSWAVPGFNAVRIYYLHSKKQIVILRVLHGRRDVDSLLEENPETAL